VEVTAADTGRVAEAGLGALRERLDGHETRLEAAAGADDVAVLGDELRRALAELQARVVEARDERLADVQRGEEAIASLERRLEDQEQLAREREAVLVAARGELASLAERLAGVEQPVHAVEAAVAAAREELARLGERLGHSERRADEADAAFAAALTRLDARVDDGAVRAAGAVAEAERALRGELDALAATVEERDAASIDARGALNDEVERIAASLGWRLEQVEQVLARGDAAALREVVESLEERVDRQAALADEQVRVTEDALRKGLASLGRRLAQREEAYVEAGDALRRSIERLGHAVAAAGPDGAQGRSEPSPEEGSYLAFAPTDEGYRLVELEGRAPAVGAELEAPGLEGVLRVTRVSRSPLPLDGRACVYLERSRS
jgi:chromosome segregation ATPase